MIKEIIYPAIFEFDKDKITALYSRQENYWNKIANANFLNDDEKKKLLDL